MHPNLDKHQEKQGAKLGRLYRFHPDAAFNHKESHSKVEWTSSATKLSFYLKMHEFLSFRRCQMIAEEHIPKLFSDPGTRFLQEVLSKFQSSRIAFDMELSVM